MRTRQWQPGSTARREIRLSPSRAAACSVAAAGGGFIAGYLLDPDRGRGRRRRLRDQAARATRVAGHGARITAKDVANRSRGVVAEARYRTSGSEVEPDVLEQRVRATLGRYVTHPHSVEVMVDGGTVTLTGHVLEREERRAARAVARVPGVDDVRTLWVAHHTPDHVPQMQGEGRPRRPRPDMLQEHWAPATRLLGAVVAVTSWLLASRLGLLARWFIRLVAALLGARAATNMPVSRLTGIAAGPRAVDVHAAVVVDAPVTETWAVVSDYPNFPELMPDILEVTASADGGRSRWSISGPVGAPIRFSAEETRREDGRMISWQSTDNRMVAHAGTLRVDPELEGRSRIAVQLSYNPVGGLIGHLAARCLRTDPAHRLREDLRLLKEAAESCARHADAA